jgi:Fe-S oxidoreductase
MTLAEELERAVVEGALRFHPQAADAATETVKLFGHCTEQALAPDQTPAWARLLEAAGFQVEPVSTGCCGMAGAFGYDPAKQDLSRRLWEQTWAEPTAAGAEAGDRLAATGYSCRSQARRFGPGQVVHPVQLLAERVDPDR